MTPRQILFALSAGLIVVGLVLGFRGLSAGDVECGSVFSPQTGGTQMADAIDENFGGEPGANQTACDNARSDQKPLAYGAIGLGIIAAFVGLANSAQRSHASTPGTPQP